MFCPECKSPEVDPQPGVVATGGVNLYPKRCRRCGYFWSDRELPKLTAPAQLSPAAMVTGGQEEGAEEPAVLDREHGFDPETVKAGQVVLFERKGQIRRGPVVSNQPGSKSVVVDVDGKPDTRVAKDELLGVVVTE